MYRLQIIGRTLATELTLEALKMTIKNRNTDDLNITLVRASNTAPMIIQIFLKVMALKSV